MTELPKYQEIARGIRWQIQSGDYEPGDLLILEELDQEWEVTSPTMFRALGQLEQDGLIQRGTEGWTVAEPPPEGSTPAVEAVTAVGYTVVLCAACGFVWGNSGETITRKGYNVPGVVADHRDRHTSGKIVTTRETGDFDG